MLRICN